MHRRQALDSDYAELRKFFEFYSNRHFPTQGLAPEHHPVALLSVLEKMSASKARAGLRQAVNDIIEMSMRFSPHEVAALDRELRGLGIITLSQVRRRQSRQVGRILKRGQIKNETEYYLIRNILDDRAEESAEQRGLLAKMISEYEAALRPPHLASPPVGGEE